MTSNEFNEKWNKYLEDGFYGMAIEHPKAIEYLDNEFTKEIEVNPSFNYAQIKMKFGTSRVYANSDKTSVWEDEVNRLVNAT
jgi:hypothetical protein